MEILKDLESIQKCENPESVKYIHLESHEYLGLTSSLAAFVNLEGFEVNHVYSFSTFPKGFFSLKKLKYIKFTYCEIHNLPKEIFTAFPDLEVLILNNNRINQIPKEIGLAKKLKILDLGKNKVALIPDTIEKLEELKSLNLCDCSSSMKGEELLLKLNGLRELMVSSKLAKKLKKEHPGFVDSLLYFYGNGALERKKLKLLLSQLLAKKCDWPLRALFLNILADNMPKARAVATLSTLLTVCNSKGEEYLRLKALELMDELFGEENRRALGQHAKIAVLGKLGINKNELRQKLKDLNIKYSASIEESSTHVLIGQLPGEAVNAAIEKGLFILTEKNINDYWETMQNPYLLEAIEASPEQLENMAALLLSCQSDSISVALAMFKQGGFPKELITELFIAYFHLEDAPDAKREAERLLRQYGSSELVSIVKKGTSLFENDYINEEYELNREVMAVCKKTELNDFKLVRHIYDDCEIGAAYLIRKLPEKEALEFIRTKLLTSDGSLSLKNLGLQSVPKVLYKMAEEIKELDFSHNYINNFPKEMSKFKNLRVLNLTKNFGTWDTKEGIACLLTALPDCKFIPELPKK